MSDKQQDILSNEDQYRSELMSFPRLKRSELRELEARARSGDEGAKGRLIIECMKHVLVIAVKLMVYLNLDELLDIVQVGNEALVRYFDAALSKDEPAGYLIGIARRLMRNYVIYNSRLIRMPEDAKRLPDAPTVMSLDDSRLASQAAMEEHGEAILRGDLIEAIEKLPPRQREAVRAMLHLEGYDPEALSRSNLYEAMRKLRQHLKEEA